jgi:hypothetical protein
VDVNLYQLTRLIRDGEVIASGDPDRIIRRARNHVVGRALARAGFWRLLWGGVAGLVP